MSIRRTVKNLALILCWTFCSAAAAGAADISMGYLASGKAFRAATTQVLPSVVRIESFGGLSGRVGGAKRAAGISKPGEGPTTGLIISADGYILTSTFNFLRQPPVITVVLPDGTQHVAKLVGRDETRKICLLKVDAANLPVPKLAPPDGLRVGQWAVSVGVGYGKHEPALSAGIISALDRIYGRAVQTDANISPANYGGPLVDIDGRVIGLCVPLSPQSGSEAAGSQWYDSGIGFAIPLAGLDAFIDRMKRGETIKTGRAGIQAQPQSAEGVGAVVSAVAVDSPAAAAGVQLGDVVVSVAGTAVLDPIHLSTLLNRYVAGDKVELEIQRGEEKLNISVQLEAGEDKPEHKPPPSAEPEKT